MDPDEQSDQGQDRHSGSVVEHPLCDREVAGSIPGQVIPKTLKMVLAALSLGAQYYESRARTGLLSVSIMWLGGISVWGVIFQWGSTLKVSIELPATSRHRHDMTERLLKATLSPNQTNWSGPHCLPVCKNRFARIFSRRHKQTTFSDAVFLGALRVK